MEGVLWTLLCHPSSSATNRIPLWREGRASAHWQCCQRWNIAPFKISFADWFHYLPQLAGIHEGTHLLSLEPVISAVSMISMQTGGQGDENSGKRLYRSADWLSYLHLGCNTCTICWLFQEVSDGLHWQFHRNGYHCMLWLPFCILQHFQSSSKAFGLSFSTADESLRLSSLQNVLDEKWNSQLRVFSVIENNYFFPMEFLGI